MTIVINENCESVTIDTLNLNVNNQSVDLTITVNCDKKYTKQIDVTDTEILITPTDVDNPDLDSLPDGVYLFELKIVNDVSTIITERKCIFINCGLGCLMTDVFKNAASGVTEDITRSLAYYALINSQCCNNCSCTDLCTLYNATKLNTCFISNATGCGCS